MGDEEYWSDVHWGFGFAFALLGVDETSAEEIFWVWEATEAVIWPLNTQGRDNFERGEEGWLEDIRRGMEGYESGSTIQIMWMYSGGILTPILIPPIPMEEDD